jgi:MarR family transcriptional regulator, organic hydroperoxide resistance regulator
VSGNDDDVVEAERIVRARVGDMDIDFTALAAVSNIFRVANAVRHHMERRVLAEYGLSWSAFVTLFVLWVWGAMESRHLAAETGVTKGTLTGIVKTLERRGLCERTEHATDRRRVVVTPTRQAEAVMRALFPRFNEHEALVTAALAEEDKRALAHHLRTILRTVEGDGSA